MSVIKLNKVQLSWSNGREISTLMQQFAVSGIQFWLLYKFEGKLRDADIPLLL